MKRGETALTAQQLAEAWQRMRRPATWPDSMAQALQDPVRANCIRGYARWLARWKATARPVHSLPTAPVPPTPTAPPSRQAARHLPNKRAQLRFDARKAAANDFDD
jgi:hypothetical protein